LSNGACFSIVRENFYFSIARHLKIVSVFHGFASLLFLDVSGDFYKRQSLISSPESLVGAPGGRQTEEWHSMSILDEWTIWLMQSHCVLIPQQAECCSFPIFDKTTVFLDAFNKRDDWHALVCQHV
jgi:hypothetical protein